MLPDADADEREKAGIRKVWGNEDGLRLGQQG